MALPAHWKIYRVTRNRVNVAVKRTKSFYIQQQAYLPANSNCPPSTCWRIARNLCDLKESATVGIPPLVSLFDQEGLPSGLTEVSTVFSFKEIDPSDVNNFWCLSGQPLYILGQPIKLAPTHKHQGVRQVILRPAGSDPEVVCQKNSFLKVSVSLGGFGPSVAHGKHSVRRRCVQATKNKAETCSLLDAIGRRSCGRWREWV